MCPSNLAVLIMNQRIDQTWYCHGSPDVSSAKLLIMWGSCSIVSSVAAFITARSDVMRGCLLGRQDRALEGGMTFSVSTVMGRRDQPLLEVAARQLAEALSLAGCDRCAAIIIEGSYNMYEATFGISRYTTDGRMESTVQS